MGRVSLENLLLSQSNVDKHVIYSIYTEHGYLPVTTLMILLRPGTIFEIKTFPQCTPYLYILMISRAQNFCKQLCIYIYI